METQSVINIFEQLVSARKTQDGRMQDIVRNVDPGRYDFFNSLLSDSSVDHSQPAIYDNTATVGYKLLAARVHANLMSPVTRWYNIRFREDTYNTTQSYKEWLEDSVQRMWQQMSESNFNHATGEMLKDDVLVGTSIVMQEPVNDMIWEGIDYTAMPVMDSYFQMGPDQRPYRIFRKIRYTREQLQDRFPDMPEDLKIDNTDESDMDAKIEVIFCVYERDDYKEGTTVEPLKRRYGYKYVLKSAAELLEEGGYYDFPGLVVRWDKTAGTEWGTGPTSNMLENIQQLQSTVAHEAEAMAKAIDPPYITTERGIIGDLDSQPGGLTVVTEMDQLAPMLPATDFRVPDMKIKDLQAMIWAGYYLDQLELKDSPAMTATEVQVRLEQMVRLMSSVVGRLQDDYQEPVLQYLFNTMLRMGQFRELPEGLEEVDLDIIYTGPISRALQSEVGQGIIQFLTLTAELGEVYPELKDLPDIDAMGRKLAELNGVPASTMRSDEEVAEIRQIRMQQQQEAMQRQALMEAGEGIDKLASGAQKLGAVQ